jgi:amidase/nitrilase
MSKIIRAAALQASPVFLDKRRTVEKFAGMIDEAGRAGASLIVTPETGIPGYPYWRGSFSFTDAASAQEWRETVLAYYRESIMIERDLAPIQKAARANSMVCVVGISEQDDRPGSQTLFNSQVVIGRDGAIVGRHRKLMPTYSERFFWGMGDATDLRVFDMGDYRLGALICFENHCTLFKAAMAMKGEEIHAACWPGYWRYTGKRMETRDMSGTVGPWHTCDQDSALREYAFETQSFVVSANMYQPPASVPDVFPYKTRSNFAAAVGGSAIVNPFGMYLVEPTIGKECIVYADLHLEDRIVAKNIIDNMGHYARWDVVSLNLREEAWEPVSRPSRRSPDPGQVESLARKHGLRKEAVDALIMDLLKQPSGPDVTSNLPKGAL